MFCLFSQVVSVHRFCCCCCCFLLCLFVLSIFKTSVSGSLAQWLKHWRRKTGVESSNISRGCRNFFLFIVVDSQTGFFHFSLIYSCIFRSFFSQFVRSLIYSARNSFYLLSQVVPVSCSFCFLLCFRCFCCCCCCCFIYWKVSFIFSLQNNRFLSTNNFFSYLPNAFQVNHVSQYCKIRDPCPASMKQCSVY